MRIKLFILTLILGFRTFGSENLDVFKDTYESCDRHFDELFVPIQLAVPTAKVYQFMYEKGIIKSYFIPAKSEQKNLLILISGTHGIEGFVGSALQRHFLATFKQRENTAILLIHGFNLWGFKNFRRVNENNIDLNRAFIIDRNRFKPDDSKYAQLNDFLNPKVAARNSEFSQLFFIASAVHKIWTYSLESLRSAILKGQYTYPDGIFYGGKEPQPQELMIDQLIQQHLAPYKNVFMVDLHTGYGENEKLHLLTGDRSSPAAQKLLSVFKESELVFSNAEKFYSVQGDLLTYFSQKLIEKTKADVRGVTFEFGTMNSQTTLGSIESLRRIVTENQDYLHRGNLDRNAVILELFVEMFYPKSSHWRALALQQFDLHLNTILNSLN